MSEIQDQYWACSECDSGGHPLSTTQASDGAQAHMERSGHFVIRGQIIHTKEPK